MIETREENSIIAKAGGNASQNAYNCMENIYVMENKVNYDWLLESKSQLEKGNICVKNLIEVDTDE